jgi:hypothetical protein
VRPDGDGVDVIAFLDESIKAKDAEIQRLRKTLELIYAAARAYDCRAIARAALDGGKS